MTAPHPALRSLSIGVLAAACAITAIVAAARPALAVAIGVGFALTLALPRIAAWMLLVGIGAPLFVLLLIAYPATALLVLALLVIGVLSVRAPLAALLLAILLFECEGIVKAALTAQGTPGGVGPEGLGAAAVDLGLAIAVVPLLWRDRLESPRRIWRAAGWLERVVLAMLPLWIALSVLQIAQTPSLKQGLDGFRLAQGYAVIVLAGIVVVGQFSRRQIIAGLMVVAGALAGYAALRTATGLSPAERVYAISRSTDFAYGSTFRSIGSLGSAVALASVLTPIFAFSVALAITSRRWRATALAVAGLALVAGVFTYTRVSLLAMAGSAVGVGILWAVLVRPSGRRVFAGALAVIALLGVFAAGVLLSSSASHSTSQRAQGFVDPAGDASVHERLDTWRLALDAFRAAPLGRGVGTIGGAAEAVGAPTGGDVPATTDNSYLKILVEQGVIGIVPFLIGVIGVLGLIVSRLLRRPPPRLGLALASLSGFGAFTVLWVAGDYIEQPGKALAWLLLGIALGEAFRRELRRPDEQRRRIGEGGNA